VTAKTRRRVLVCVVAMLLTLPIETILLRAISTPDSKQAVREWVAGLSADELDQAASQIESYPFGYRREIVRALSGGKRVAVWQRHIRTYRNSHPGLDVASVELLDAAVALLTPEFFSAPTSAERAQAKAIGDQLTALIGRGEAEYVLYRLGPRDGTFASLEPLSERAANWVRRLVTALADAEDCDCSSDWGCGGGAQCRTGTRCTPDESWPAGGGLWNETCDGICAAGGSSN